MDTCYLKEGQGVNPRTRCREKYLSYRFIESGRLKPEGRLDYTVCAQHCKSSSRLGVALNARSCPITWIQKGPSRAWLQPLALASSLGSSAASEALNGLPSLSLESWQAGITGRPKAVETTGRSLGWLQGSRTLRGLWSRG